jgi:NADPH:quinone reductase-like Zn-dependent oxidoreductase
MAHLVRSLGADEVIDYTRDDFSCAATDQDVVLDLVGNRSLADARRPLSPNGTLVLSGGGTSQGGSAFGPLGLMLKGRAANPFLRQRIRMLPAKPSAANLATLRSLAESGAIRPILERTYPLAETIDAIRHLETEHARAKLVVSLSV